jgi:hypothetical protein
MPTIVNVKGYRLYFVSFDGSEPMHIHIRKDNHNAKVWIESMEFAWSQFKGHENAAILRMVLENKDLIKDKWYEYFGY